MARTLLTVSTTDVGTGLVITAGVGTAGTADGHEVKLTRLIYVIVENTSVTATTVSFVASNNTTLNGVPFTDQTTNMANSETKLFGPFEQGPFKSASDGLMDIDFESAKESNLKVIAISCPAAP